MEGHRLRTRVCVGGETQVRRMCHPGGFLCLPPSSLRDFQDTVTAVYHGRVSSERGGTHKCTQVHTHTQRLVDTCTQVHTHTHRCTHTYTGSWTHTYRCTCTHTHVHRHRHTQVHTHIHTCARAHTQAQTHTHSQ